MHLGSLQYKMSGLYIQYGEVAYNVPNVEYFAVGESWIAVVITAKI